MKCMLSDALPFRCILLGLMTLFSALTACAPTQDSSLVEQPGGCLNAESCPAESTCSEGLCIAKNAPDWPIVLRIIPTTDQPFATTDLEPVQFDDGSQLNLGRIALTRRVRFFGSARLLDGPNVPVRVALRTRTDKMPPTVYWGETISDAGGARFSLSIPDFWPGSEGGLRSVLYSLVAYPIDKTRMPPWRIDSFQPPNPGGRIDLEMSAEESLLTVSGQARMRESLPLPVVGARVYMVDDNGRQVSSESRTSETGSFSLRLWPTSAGQSYVLRLMGTAESGALPDIAQPVTIPESGEAETVVVDLDMTTQLVTVTGQVLGVTPLVGTALRFAAPIGRGTFRVDVPSTDDDGRFRVSLYPGEYEVDIIPPVQSRYRLSRLTATIDGQEPLEFRPQPRAIINGRMTGKTDVPLRSARVKVTLTRPLFRDPSLVRDAEFAATRASFAQTDDNGGVVFQVDPGEHLVEVHPARETGIVPFQSVLTIPALENAVTEFELTAPAAGLIRLQLTDDASSAIGGALVEAWRVDGAIAERIATTRSGADGLVRLAVPLTARGDGPAEESPLEMP
ncbi:MAG: hypothetical protein VX589_02160 [Myxococcota bacterium]|nr:hypothetical protein [Myxococcota bacterium]